VDIAVRVFNLGIIIFCSVYVSQNYSSRHSVPMGTPVAVPGQYVYNAASQPVPMYGATPPNFYPQQQMFVQQVQVCSNVRIHVVSINCNKKYAQQMEWINKS
jgi:hypothetical protein